MKSRPRRSRASRFALIARDVFRHHRTAVVATMALTTILAGGASLGFALNQDTPETAVGLQGAWPDFPPPSLSVAEFSKLDGNWAYWSQAAAINVANLYSLADADLQEQRARLAQVDRDVRVLERAIRDPAYHMIRDELTGVRVPLKLRADLFRASLNLVTADAAPAARQAVTGVRIDFQNAISRVRSDLNMVPNGNSWLPYLELDAIERDLQAGGVPQRLDALAIKLDPTFEGLADEQAKFLDRASLQNLASTTRAYDAMLKISQEGSDPNAVREQLGLLIESIDLHEDSPTDESAAAIRDARRDLRLVAGPLAAPFDDLIRKQFLNYNFRLVADAAFISKIVSTNKIDCGPIQDCFMGASIYGNQRTNTSANLAFIPSEGVAQFELVLDGISNSSTTAYTNQATVASVGQHYFHATKPISFNGDRFQFGPAQVSVNPNIRHTGISTKYDNILFGLFKGMIRRRAMSEANERIPEGRAHAAEEMQARLLPEFNGQVENQFGQVNAELAGFDARLAGEDLTPKAERVRTTSDRFLFDAAIRGGSEVSGSAPNIGSTRGVGFTLQIHESLLNNMADRWDIAGKSMTEAQVRDHLEQWFSRVLNRQVNFDDTSGKPADPSVLTFHTSDPVRFEVVDGAIRLILRAGITTEDGTEVPTQVVEVPLNLVINNGQIQISRGTVIVSPLERPRNRALQITRAGVMRRKIENAIQNSTQDGTLTIQRNGDQPIQIYLQRLTAQAGWLTVFGI